MEALADAVGLGMLRLGLRVLNVIQSQIDLIVVLLRFATVLGAPSRASTPPSARAD